MYYKLKNEKQGSEAAMIMSLY